MGKTCVLESIIPKLSAGLSLMVSIVVRRTVEEGKSSLRAAVLRAGGSDADRRLLSDVAYRWHKGRQLRERTFKRILRILARINPGAAKDLRERFWTKEGRDALYSVLLSSDWAEIASPLELALLMRQPEGRFPPEIHAPLRDRLPVLRTNSAVARDLDEFQKWAKRCGHNKWVVQACLQRALGPLVSAARTRGVLPGWDDLKTPANRHHFVAIRLEAERMMLATKPAHLRAMERFASPDALRERMTERPPRTERPAGSAGVHVRCQDCLNPYRLTDDQLACPRCGAPPPGFANTRSKRRTS